MTETVKTIRLYGKLGTKFGRVHNFVCSSPAEAIRVLCQMIPGFKRYLNLSKSKGLGYTCFIGKSNLGEDMLHTPAGKEDIRIAPIILGSGRGGFFQILLGAALIGAAFLTGGASLGASGLVFSNAAWQVAFGLGASLILGGVAQMLTRPPSGLQSVESVENKASYQFNGPQNTQAQGNPVPLFYGRMIVGSATISSDLFTEDQV